MKKRNLILVLVLAMVIGAIGCGKKQETNVSEKVEVENHEKLEERDLESGGVVEGTTDEVHVTEVVEVMKPTETEEATEETKANTVMDETDWTSFTFEVNGNSITLPCTYQEILSTIGVSMSSSDEKSYLSPNYYTLVTFKDETGKSRFNAQLANLTEEDQCYTDCMVTRISQTAHSAEDGDLQYVATFPGGVTAGTQMDADAIISALGEPTDVHEYADGDYWSNTYTWCINEDWTSTNKYEIVIANGKVDSVLLDNR